MSDLIPVRTDETFNVSALTEWIRTLESSPDGTPIVEQFSGGKANLTYLLTWPGGEELVLRRPPLGPLAPGSHDMHREFQVLSRLWKAFPLAPRAVGFCDDETIIGAPFFVMERREGVVVRGVVPQIFGGGEDPENNRKLSEVVVDTLADFHAVDPSSCGLDDLGRPEGFLERQVEGWIGRWSRAQHEPNSLADELGAWLRDHLPANSATSLLHNDWRLDNMAVAAEDPGECVAVFDWDMATRGDPLADLGTLMGSWFDPGEAPDDLGMMPTTAPGWLTRDEAVARYAARTGRDYDDFDWYLVFGAWKLAIILQQIYIRWLNGQTQDERFANLNLGASLLFQLAAARRPNT